MVTYNLTPDVSLFYSHTIYRFNKHYYPTSLVYTRDGTYTNNLNIGVMYSFDAFRNFLIRDDEGNPMRRPLFLEYGIGPTFMSKTPLKVSRPQVLIQVPRWMVGKLCCWRSRRCTCN